MMTNDDRVEDITPAIRDFAQRMGLTMDDGPATIAGDMIASILHWAQTTGEVLTAKDGRLTALEAARCGIAHYVTESYIDYDAEPVDELGPESDVTVLITCLNETWLTSTGGAEQIVPEDLLATDTIKTCV